MSSALVDFLIQPSSQSAVVASKQNGTKGEGAFAASVNEAYDAVEQAEAKHASGVMDSSLVIPSLYAVPVPAANDESDQLGIRMRDRLLGEEGDELLSDEAFANDEALLQAMIAEEGSAEGMLPENALSLPEAGEALERPVVYGSASLSAGDVELAALSDDAVATAIEEPEVSDWINVADMIAEESAVSMQPLNTIVDETMIVSAATQQTQPQAQFASATATQAVQNNNVASHDSQFLAAQQAPALSATPVQRDARTADAAQDRLRDMTAALQSRNAGDAAQIDARQNLDISQRLAGTPNPQSNAFLSDVADQRSELQWQTFGSNTASQVNAQGQGSQQLQTPTGVETLTVFDGSHQRQIDAASGQQRPHMMQFQQPAMAQAEPGEQVAVKIQQAALAGQDRITMQLDPADLGRVDIRMEIGQDGRTQMLVTAENRDTLNLLQRDARQLEQALQQAGLDLDGGSMEFNLSQQQQDNDELAQNSHSGQHGSSKGYESQVIEEQEAHYIDPFTGRYTIQVNDGLDIKV